MGINFFFEHTSVSIIKDGKLFDEIRKGNDDRKQFFNKIIDVVSLLGGDLNHVI